VAEPFRMKLEMGKVREFAAAVHSAHPEHLEDEEAVTPATFLMTQGFWAGPESSVFAADRDMSRMLHGGVEFTFPAGPPRTGSWLTGQAAIDRVWTKEGKRGGTMTFTDIVTRFTDETGAVVAEVRSTAIETSKATNA
jgi:hypothetical protein